ncbi:MAG TPA: ThiF family adenylyltransferase [Flavobacteriales bacterium]|nr:ThiF family adenylyltransferase [Flavobacteriales bacterium]
MSASASTGIAVIGTGALGSALLPCLLGQPIQSFTLVDGDRVEASNLSNQPLFNHRDVGEFKVDALCANLRFRVPNKQFTAVPRFLSASNARALLCGHGVVADCTDDLHAKELIDRVCAELRIPLVSGALHRDQGQVLVLLAKREGNACARSDVFAGRIGPDQDGCDMQLVPMHAIEAVAQRMSDAIAELIGDRHMVNGALDLYEGAQRQWISFRPAAAW